MLKEQAIIDLLTNAFPDANGIGDDAAVFPAGPNESYVVTKDILAEDVHFRRSYVDPESLAHKSLHVNLSDVAAMGATPLHILLGISLPPDINETYAVKFLNAFARSCKDSNVSLIGGDTTGSKHGVFISVTAIGRVVNTNIKWRRNALPGDIVCVCGEMGDAHAGLVALEKNMPGAEQLKEKLLRPTARSGEGLWFGGRPEVTAMMDLSDGLYVDLQKLCRASNAGAEILLDQLIPSPALTAISAAQNIDPLECMVAGGEDYGLLLTVRPEAFTSVAQSFQKDFGDALKPVGNIVQGRGVQLMQKGQAIPFSYRPFSHFGE